MGLETDILSFISKEEAIEYYFRYYREHGYPNYDFSNYNSDKELNKLIYFDDSSVIKDRVCMQAMLGCGFLWCYFPHWIEVSTLGDKSLKENWEDDKKLRDLIEKCMNYCIKHERGKWSTNRVRQLSKVYLSKQSPSNFRPTVAKAIYNRYGNRGSVWDPCGGWGGRLFGFLASNCREYTCCEPSTKTYEGLLQLRDTYKYLDNKKVTISKSCQEDFDVREESYDLVFTSPPYFDAEKYSEEDTQSYIRYPTELKWVKGFLKVLIENAYKGLKPGGYFLLNIANTVHATNIEEFSYALGVKTGFILEDMLKLQLSSISGKGVKYEPIFVFRKKK